jgi:hypothetical protein
MHTYPTHPFFIPSFKNTKYALENRVLRRIFGPKGNEVTGERRKLHNEELHDLYFSPSIIRIIKLRMKWAGTGSTNRGEEERI